MKWPFCRHHWKTIDSYPLLVYRQYDDPNVNLPIRGYQIIEQECTICGKRIINRYPT